MSNSSSSVQEALPLPTAETLKSELESLQLLNERLNGECFDGLSYPELWSLENQLAQAMVTVEHQTGKAELELIAKEEADPDYTGIEWGDEKIFESEFVLLAARTNLRKQARELRISSSSGERQEEQNIEHVKSEIERVRLLNERLNGQELDGLNYYELEVLRCEISIGWGNVMRERLRRREESSSQGEMLKRVSGQTQHEQSSMDNATT